MKEFGRRFGGGEGERTSLVSPRIHHLHTYFLSICSHLTLALFTTCIQSEATSSIFRIRYVHTRVCE